MRYTRYYSSDLIYPRRAEGGVKSKVYCPQDTEQRDPTVTVYNSIIVHAIKRDSHRDWLMIKWYIYYQGITSMYIY